MVRVHEYIRSRYYASTRTSGRGRSLPERQRSPVHREIGPSRSSMERPVAVEVFIMTGRSLKTVTRTQGNNRALKDGTIRPRSFEFEFQEVPVLIDAFRRMVRGLEYDICEMALTTYLCAKAHGKQMTGLPIFLVRGFHHGAIVFNTKAGISDPTDLEGKRVGVNRGYTVTTGVWARGILQDEFGVDLSRITWVLSGDEHVAEYTPPSNVVSMGEGRDMADLLIAGELAAAIGISVDHPDVKTLIPDADQAGLDALRSHGLYPINHLIVVRDDVLASQPGWALEIFEAFAKAKNLYVDRLKQGTIETPTQTDDMYLRVMNMDRDPLPYGIAPNRPVIQTLIDHAVTQKIIDSPIPVEDLFPEITHGLQL